MAGEHTRYPLPARSLPTNINTGIQARLGALFSHIRPSAWCSAVSEHSAGQQSVFNHQIHAFVPLDNCPDDHQSIHPREIAGKAQMRTHTRDFEVLVTLYASMKAYPCEPQEHSCNYGGYLQRRVK